ncbi:MAG: MBOAT family protein [Clostridium sp.]|nr:MBOAT family protein [Clostridium sp.]
MLFNSAVFLLLFLPITFVMNFFVKKQYSNILLLVASLIFYAWGEPVFVLLMIISILYNWLVGQGIGHSEGVKKKAFLLIGLIYNLGILGYYKYTGLIISIINSIFQEEVLDEPQIVLPIGLSFFTFQAISYIVDIYREEIETSSNLVNTALYISFFPQLIAGPIVKYRDINKQIINRTISWPGGVAAGFKRFIYGLSKKVLISNVLGLCVDTIYSYNIESIDGRMAWIGALSYTFQIYYDFSGYSDMAIGLGKMFGFDILDNFNYPYLSRSINEFWRRWHISLGTWFREYVYIPLGGNRKGNTYINLIIVFFLTGLWHGADFSFIVWGLYHGLFSIFERIGFKKVLDRLKIISIFYCFFVVNIGWVFFRAYNTFTAIRYISRMIMPWRHMEINVAIWNYMNNKTVFAGVCAIIGMGLLNKMIPRKIIDKWKNSIAESLYCVFLLILCLAAIASNAYNPFIYFQF